MLGVLFAVLSAFSFSLSDILVRRGVRIASASEGAFITVLLGVPLFFLAALVTGQLLRFDSLSLPAYGYLAAAGIVHFVFGRYCNYRAIGAIGAARTSPIQALSLPYSALTALFLLGEGINAVMALGILLILAGPLIMVERQPAPVAVAVANPARTSAHGEEHFQPRQLEGYVFAVLASVGYGSSPVLIRAALEGESGLSLLGGLVSYVAAAGLLLLSLAAPNRRALLQSLNPTSVRLFFGAGFAVFMAQMFRFLALSLTSVAVATSLLRLGSIFTLVLSWWMNRSLEAINLRVVAGILISVGGAVLLILARE